VIGSRPPSPPTPEDELILQALPEALKLARALARLRCRVCSRALLEDCEQIASQALLEARPGYDKARGPFGTYAWKRVAGAVTRLLARERAVQRAGLDDALDASEELRDESDPFGDEDDDARGQLKGFCRLLTFRRVMGDARVTLQEKPEDTLLRARIFQALTEALGELDEQEMRLLELRYWKELTWEEVAKEMGMSDRNAKRIDEQLRERLRRDLRHRGVEEAPPSVQV
jgi:RNA polymerase sigma factor FliA